MHQLIQPGRHGIIDHARVESNKGIIATHYVTLGLMKIFVKAMDKTGKVFLYLCNTFLYLSEAKL